MNVLQLCALLRERKIRTVYLIHEVFRESEARQFAEKIKAHGVSPLIAADYRLHGKAAVSEAIAKADFSLLLAFDEQTQRMAEERGIAFVTLELNG